MTPNGKPRRCSRRGGGKDTPLVSSQQQSSQEVRGALAIARRGLRVHPIVPDRKVALLDDWPNQATLDPTTIKSWWKRWPNANVAIATGGEARLLVVDIDPDAGGEAQLVGA